jgi:hypothetical protein
MDLEVKLSWRSHMGSAHGLVARWANVLVWKARFDYRLLPMERLQTMDCCAPHRDGDQGRQASDAGPEDVKIVVLLCCRKMKMLVSYDFFNHLCIRPIYEALSGVRSSRLGSTAQI